MKYYKDIQSSSTGMVIAKVYDENMECKGLEFFTQFFTTNKSVEKSFKKAHKWADERIAICERNESIVV